MTESAPPPEPTVEMRVVTVQNIAPLIYALVAGLVYGLIGAAQGAGAAAAAVQAAGGDINLGALAIGALIGFSVAFVNRALEGLRDQGRVATVPVGTPVGEGTT